MISSGYLGSKELKKSNGNEEVIPKAPSNWTNAYKMYKFSFINYQDCHVIINNTSPIFLKSNQGFSMDRGDKKIESFIVLDSGVDYNWIGAY